MQPDPAPLLPRELFFGNPDRSNVQISPDGIRLSWLAPLDGVLNVWVAPAGAIRSARPATSDRGRGIRNYSWAYNNRQLLYLQDEEGDENWRVYSVDLEEGSIRNLTPFENVRASIAGLSAHFPDEVILAHNARDPQWQDLHRVDLRTGESTLLLENRAFTSFVVDDRFEPRLGLEMKEGGWHWKRRAGDAWDAWIDVSPEDSLTTTPYRTDREARELFLSDSRNRNTAALAAIDFASGTRKILAEHPQADLSDVLFHPTEHRPQAAAFTWQRKEWQVLDPELRPDFDQFTALGDGEVSILSRSLDDTTWVVSRTPDDGPVSFYLHDRGAGATNFLFHARDELAAAPLVRMHPAVIPSRDGLDLVSYYTLPPGTDPDGEGIPVEPLPLVFKPHGGPWHRDAWGYQPMFQWLSNRGYAVLATNFRASTGFGKAFVNAGDREWGGKIIEDQVDAVRWAIDSGIADASRIAIFGGSFGGYSVLAGLSLHPELYACGIDLVGVANLITWMEAIPAYWKPMRSLLAKRVGDPDTEAGRAFLRSHSPTEHAHRITRPLLVGQGANDPRVRKAESDQIVAALRQRDIPVRYLLFPDEGHGFLKPENNLAFYAAAEAFLAEHLGGRCEPPGSTFEASSAIEL